MPAQARASGYRSAADDGTARGNQANGARTSQRERQVEAQDGRKPTSCNARAASTPHSRTEKLRTSARARLDDLEIVRDLDARASEHDGGGAVFLRREVDRALHRLLGQAATGYAEMHVDLGEYLGLALRALGLELGDAAFHRLTRLPEDVHLVVCRAGPHAHQHQLPRAPAEIAAPALGRAVEHHGMAAARLRHELGLFHPLDARLHIRLSNSA